MSSGKILSKWTGAELTSVVCDLTEGGLSDRWSAILNLQEKPHNLAFFRFIYRKLSLALLSQNLCKFTVVSDAFE